MSDPKHRRGDSDLEFRLNKWFIPDRPTVRPALAPDTTRLSGKEDRNGRIHLTINRLSSLIHLGAVVRFVVAGDEDGWIKITF
jgi:hypothetical protein